MSIPPPTEGLSPPTTPLPGWYPDPDPQGRGQRYWDGTAWTVNVAPFAAAASKAEATTGDWIGGMLLAVLVPMVGFLAGLYYLTKNGTKRQVGALTVGLSCVTFALWLIVASSH